jgi:hypothetical protein
MEKSSTSSVAIGILKTFLHHTSFLLSAEFGVLLCRLPLIPSVPRPMRGSIVVWNTSALKPSPCMSVNRSKIVTEVFLFRERNLKSASRTDRLENLSALFCTSRRVHPRLSLHFPFEPFYLRTLRCRVEPPSPPSLAAASRPVYYISSPIVCCGFATSRVVSRVLCRIALRRVSSQRVAPRWHV